MSVSEPSPDKEISVHVTAEVVFAPPPWEIGQTCRMLVSNGVHAYMHANVRDPHKQYCLES